MLMLIWAKVMLLTDSLIAMFNALVHEKIKNKSIYRITLSVPTGHILQEKTPKADFHTDCDIGAYRMIAFCFLYV